MEQWKPIVGYLGYYEVSDAGRVRTVDRLVRFVSKKGREAWRLKKGRLIALPVANTGYAMAYLARDNHHSARTVHSVVAEAFIGPRPAGYDVCHNDGDRLNNTAANLRYDTRTNNHRDKIAHGTAARGSKIPGAKLTEADIPVIRRLALFETDVVVARRYGVAPQTIRRVLDGTCWKHC